MRELNVNEIQYVNGGIYGIAVIVAKGAIALGPKIENAVNSMNDALNSLYSGLRETNER